MPDYFDSHVETRYLNTPFFIQLQRVWRKIKKMPEADKPKKLGFYLQNIRGLEGSAQTNEKIVKDIFGNAQQMTPNEFKQRIFSYEIPKGKATNIRHETSYQQTQRLVAGRGEEERINPASSFNRLRTTNISQSEGGKSPREFGVSGGKKPPFEPLNQTIQASIYGDIYENILKEYKDYPDADNAIRAINRNLDGHFTNASAFLRWTKLTPSWIHVDAFQTDFFNKLKSMEFSNKKEHVELLDKIIEQLRKHENEFFKATISYMHRTNPQVKVYTANTEDLVKAVEHVRGDVKLKEYYYKLPKVLGFKLIDLPDLEKKLHLEPEKRALEAHFKPALQRLSQNSGTEDIVDAVATIKVKLGQLKIDKAGKEITKEEIDESIRQADVPDQIASAFHQFLDELTEVMNGRLKKLNSAGSKETKVAIGNYIESKKEFIKDFMSKTGGPGAKIWWADARMLFEHVNYDKRLVLESIRGLAGF